MKRLAQMICLTLLELNACTSTTVEGARTPFRTNPMQRVCVLVDDPPGDAGEEVLRRALDRELSKRGLVIQSRIVWGLDIQDPSISRAITDFHPDGLLAIRLGGGALSAGDYAKLVGNVELVALPGEQRVWVGRLVIDAGPLGSPSTEDTVEAVDGLVRLLFTAGVFAPRAS